MKKFIAICALFTLPLFALEDIEKLLVQSAKSPEEKAIARDYLLKVAKDHKDLANRYRGLAKGNRSGKAIYQEKQKAEMLDLAEKFDQDSKVYEDEAAKLK